MVRGLLSFNISYLPAGDRVQVSDRLETSNFPRSKLMQTSPVVTAVSLTLIVACAQLPTEESYHPALRLAADSTVAPLANGLITSYEQLSPDLQISLTVRATPLSAEGLAAHDLDGVLGIQPIRGQTPEVVAIGQVQIAIIVNTDSELEELSLSELGHIFSGVITDWGEIDNFSGTIQIVSWEQNNALRVGFESLMPGDEPLSPSAVIVSSESQMLRVVGNTREAIGYLPYSSVDISVKPVAIDGVYPSLGRKPDAYRYALSLPLVFVARNITETDTRMFLDWILGDDGQATIAQFASPSNR